MTHQPRHDTAHRPTGENAPPDPDPVGSVIDESDRRPTHGIERPVSTVTVGDRGDQEQVVKNNPT